MSEFSNSLVVNNYGAPQIQFTHGKGSTLYDSNKKKYIDFLSGIAVNALGHANQKLVRAICRQAKRQIHISNYFLSDIGTLYAKKLLSATGFSGAFFGNSGAEANEAAIKLARKFGYQNGGEKRRTIFTLEKSFHGRTLATLTATGQQKFHPPYFAPFVSDFKTLLPNDFSALENAFDDTTAAVLIECVQGEGGVNIIEKDWALALAEKARNAGALVMADEVQTGMGRTGALLASEELGLNADVVTLAKGIAGGVPMGACIFRGRADGVFVAGDHQSTFGGNPLACAAANAVLDELLSPGFLQRVIENGNFIQKNIQSWNSKNIAKIRGRGLLIGVELVAQKSATKTKSSLLEKGLCVSVAGENTIRIAPPLNISKKEISLGLEILKSELL